MIAAVYARTPTEQVGVADDEKSVARQVEHARAYATMVAPTGRDRTYAIQVRDFIAR